MKKLIAEVLSISSNILLWIIIILSNIFTMFWIVSIIFHFEDEKEAPKNLKDYPSVAIAIPAFNEEKTIYKTLKSLLDLEYDKKKMHIVVVNDGSSDKTSKKVREFIKKFGKKVKITFIDRKENKGKGASLNDALEKTKEKFFVVLDADTYPSKDSLKRLVERFELLKKKYKIGAVVSNIKVSNPKNIITKFQRFEYIFTQLMRDVLYSLGMLYITPGAFTLYPTSVLKKIGGFDEKTVTEDFEIALRLKNNGYYIGFSKDSVVKTKVPETLKSYLKQRIRWNVGFMENSKKYFGKLLSKNEFSLFGHFLYPSTLISLVVLIVYSIMRIITSVNDLIYDIKLFHYTGKVYLFDINLVDWLLSLNLTLYIPIISIFILSVILYLKSFNHGGEKIKNYWNFLAYLLVYPIIATAIWVVTPFYYHISYKKQIKKVWLR